MRIERHDVALAATLHDATGALVHDVRRWLPWLQARYAAVAVATSPPTSRRIVGLLSEAGAYVGTPPPPASPEPARRLGERREPRPLPRLRPCAALGRDDAARAAARAARRPSRPDVARRPHAARTPVAPPAAARDGRRREPPLRRAAGDRGA